MQYAYLAYHGLRLRNIVSITYDARNLQQDTSVPLIPFFAVFNTFYFYMCYQLQNTLLLFLL